MGKGATAGRVDAFANVCDGQRLPLQKNLFMYDVPSREDIAEVTINRAVVEGKKLPLIRKKQDKSAA